MKNEKFDRILSDIRNEQVDDQVVAKAGERVWKSITGACCDARTQLAHAAKLRGFSGADPVLCGQATGPGTRIAV